VFHFPQLPVFFSFRKILIAGYFVIEFFSTTFTFYASSFIITDDTQPNELNEDASTQNGIDSRIHLNTQKYSQILGDHHSNYSTQLNFKNSSSSASHHNNFKNTRSYNKENYYNQRSGVKNNAQKTSWQRSSTFRSSNSLKDKRSDENGKSEDGRVTSPSEPLKFNEGTFIFIKNILQHLVPISNLFAMFLVHIYKLFMYIIT
jgi:hypothetical protein